MVLQKRNALEERTKLHRNDLGRVQVYVVVPRDSVVKERVCQAGLQAEELSRSPLLLKAQTVVGKNEHGRTLDVVQVRVYLRLIETHRRGHAKHRVAREYDHPVTAAVACRIE